MRLVLVKIIAPMLLGEGDSTDRVNEDRLPKHVPQPLHFPLSWAEGETHSDRVKHVGEKGHDLQWVFIKGYQGWAWISVVLSWAVTCSIMWRLLGGSQGCGCVWWGRASSMLSSPNFVLTHGHVFSHSQFNTLSVAILIRLWLANSWILSVSPVACNLSQCCPMCLTQFYTRIVTASWGQNIRWFSVFPLL